MSETPGRDLLDAILEAWRIPQLVDRLAGFIDRHPTLGRALDSRAARVLDAPGAAVRWLLRGGRL